MCEENGIERSDCERKIVERHVGNLALKGLWVRFCNPKHQSL